MILIVILSMLLSNHGVSGNTAESKYVKEKLCDLDERIQAGCSQKVTLAKSSKSVLQCVSLCSRNESCNGASVDDSGDCFFHSDCPNVGACSVENTNHQYVGKFCVHGTWNISLGLCECYSGIRGVRCNVIQQDCNAFSVVLGYPQAQWDRPAFAVFNVQHHSTLNGFHLEISNCDTRITITTNLWVKTVEGRTVLDVKGCHRVYIDPDGDGLNPVNVLCEINTSWYPIIFMRNEGNMDFNRTWLEYQTGFSADNNNLWGGFDTWIELNKAGYRTIFVVHFDDSRSLSIRYANVQIDAADEYRITSLVIDTQYGSNPYWNWGMRFGECLEPSLLTQFSTWDRDNTNGNECASKTGFGWWHYDSNCDLECSPLGLGFVHWTTKPTIQLFSVRGIDMGTYADNIVLLEIYLER